MNKKHTNKKKILFISHDASRSGAPFVLLYLLQWLKQHTDLKFDVLLLKDGPVIEEFQKVADNVYILQNLNYDYTIKGKILRKLRIVKLKEISVKKLAEKIKIFNYGLIYGNTIVSLHWLLDFKKLYGINVISAIHELRINMELFHSREYLSNHFPQIDTIIAGSQAVANDLIERYGIEKSKIKIVHAFIHKSVTSTRDDKLLASIGIDDNRFIIGGVGNAEWRKGVDLLLPLGMYLKKHFPKFNYHIIWIGGNSQNPLIKNLLIDIEKVGLNDNITILDNTSNYLNIMNCFNIFAMLSREDPFPLVSLEAAYLGKPIVMFEGTGGTAELMMNGGGEILPYLDIEALAETIVNLSNNRELMDSMGKTLRNEVVNKYTSQIACQKVYNILKSYN